MRSTLEGVPTSLLGWSYLSWSRPQIRFLLDFYEWRYDTVSHTKLSLMHELDLLVQEYDLNKRDRMNIFKAHQSGAPLPDRKPRIRTVPHPTFPPQKKALRREVAPNQARTGLTSQPGVAATIASGLQAPNDALPEGCVVCFEPLNQHNIQKRKITSSCGHESDICRSCLAISISTQLDSKIWNEIDCPTCRQRLEFQDVKAAADPAVFERYDRYSLESCLSSGQFQRCRHPNCQSGQQCFPEQDSYMVCMACGGRTCITCDIIWHPSETCAEIAARRAEVRGTEEAAATQYLTSHVKLCPRCNVRGEKVSGCDHMKCPQCRYEYCWVCLVDYAEVRRQGNTAHRKDCRHHSDNLPAVLERGEILLDQLFRRIG